MDSFIEENSKHLWIFNVKKIHLKFEHKSQKIDLNPEEGKSIRYLFFKSLDSAMSYRLQKRKIESREKDNLRAELEVNW